jgi:hypothetical protein
LEGDGVQRTIISQQAILTKRINHTHQIPSHKRGAKELGVLAALVVLLADIAPGSHVGIGVRQGVLVGIHRLEGVLGHGQLSLGCIVKAREGERLAETPGQYVNKLGRANRKGGVHKYRGSNAIKSRWPPVYKCNASAALLSS